MASDDLRAKLRRILAEADGFDPDLLDPNDYEHADQILALFQPELDRVAAKLAAAREESRKLRRAFKGMRKLEEKTSRQRDEARAQVAAVEAKAAEWEQLAPADDWGMTPSDTVLADAGRYLKALVIKAASQPSAHSCGNCEGIDPGTCLNNPDRTKES